MWNQITILIVQRLQKGDVLVIGNGFTTNSKRRLTGLYLVGLRELHELLQAESKFQFTL